MRRISELAISLMFEEKRKIIFNYNSIDSVSLPSLFSRVDRGFQGVMKRHGYRGQPASHGQTKTHRRPGSIGGGIKHRVWPGKELPGHMGNRWRLSKGCKIWRINTKTNTLWVSGHAIPGNTNGLVYIYDSILPLRRPMAPHFPTFTGNEADLPEDIYAEDVHPFTAPTIFYEPEK